MTNVIYTVKTHELSYADLKIKEVKIGRTSNINSTIAQYRRGLSNLKLLDLWYPNEEKTVSQCEKGVLELAEKYAYERSRETFKFLQDGYENFSENVSYLLVPTSLDELEKSKQDQKEGKEIPKETKRSDYTGTKPDFFVLDDEYCEVDTWRDVLSNLVSKIHEYNDDFERILDIQGRSKNYFSKNSPEGMRSPDKIEGTNYYFETNLSANQIMKIVDRVLDKFDYDEDDFKLALVSDQV